MSLARQLLFVLLHPIVGLRYIRRLVVSQKLRRHYATRRTVTPRSGVITGPPALEAFEIRSAAELTTEAEAILMGKRCLYGHASFTVKGKTDWQKDYLSNFTWELKFHEDISYKYPEGVDIKNPWELSRLHHVVAVARAYRVTKKETYAQFVVTEITDWIEKNPTYHGVNWKVAMEVGIRAANLLLAYDLVRDSQQATEAWTALVLGSLYEHGEYIMHNLEVYGVRSNHYFADLVGLAWIGALCPDLPRAQTYLGLATRELDREVLHQFLPDGLNFESSLAYHRLVLEMLGFTLHMLQRHGLNLSTAATTRAQLAFAAIKAVTGPNGEIPQIGDNDSGRFFLTGSYFAWNALDVRHLWILEHALFEKPAVADNFPHGGMTILEDATWKVVLATVPIGQDKNGGHNHDDAGSISLWHKGQSLIVDPGTGYYTSHPELRNYFRAYSTHNGPVVNGQAPEPDPSLFTNGTHVASHGRKDGNRATATLTAATFTATREVVLTEQGLTLTDQANGTLTVLLTLSAGITPVLEEGLISLGQARLELLDQTTATFETVSYSPAYAKVETTAAIRLRAEGGTLRFRLR